MKKTEKKPLVSEVFLLIFLIGILFIVIMLFNSKTIVSNEGDINEKQAILICTLNNNQEGPFYSSLATNVSHEVKVLLNEDKLDTLYYTYEGLYSTNDEAEKTITHFHADYDIDLSENSIRDKPESHFSYVKNNGRISLRMTNREINPITGKYIFMEDIFANNIRVRNDDEIKKYYEGVGFICKYN